MTVCLDELELRSCWPDLNAPRRGGRAARRDSVVINAITAMGIQPSLHLGDPKKATESKPRGKDLRLHSVIPIRRPWGVPPIATARGMEQTCDPNLAGFPP